MRKLLKMSALLTAFIMCFSLCGCDSENDSLGTIVMYSSESETETFTEETTEALTDPSIEELTENETTIAEQQSFKKDETIVNLLKNGFSVDNMGTPTVNFVSETNTYAVIVPIESASLVAEFVMNDGGEKWDTYVETFDGMVNAAIDAIQTLKHDESINVRVAHISSIESPLPFIYYENKNKIFDRYNAEESEEIEFVLKTLFDLYPVNGIFDLQVKYDSDKSDQYTAYFYTNTIDAFKNEEYCELFSDISGICEEYIKSYDNPTVTVNVLEANTDKLICTVENNEITYNVFN